MITLGATPSCLLKNPGKEEAGAINGIECLFPSREFDQDDSAWTSWMSYGNIVILAPLLGVYLERKHVALILILSINITTR